LEWNGSEFTVACAFPRGKGVYFAFFFLHKRWLSPHRSSSTDVDALVKEGYVGGISRPVFPLTAEFAALSNNSAVAMSGRAVVIDVRSRAAYE
jgi:hypothetical protein